MTKTEERLSDALAARARSVHEESLRPLAGPGRAPRRWARKLAPAAAATAVAVIAVLALILSGSPPVPAGKPGPSGYIFSYTSTRAGASVGWMTRISTGTGAVSKPIRAAPEVLDALFAPGGKTMYVLNLAPGELIPVNTATGRMGRPVGGHWNLGEGAMAMTPDGRTIYVLDVAPAAVIPVHTATNTAGRPIRVGRYPTGIAITPNGKTAYVVSQQAGTVTPIDLATNTASKPISVGNMPWHIVITPNGRTAYVGYTPVSGPTKYKDDAVLPIDLSTNTVGRRIWTGKNASDLVVTPDGKTLYVANTSSGTVTPVNTSTSIAAKPIYVGKDLNSIAISPDGKVVYALTSGEYYGRVITHPGLLVPIDTATNTVGKAVPAGIPGPGPIDIVITPDGRTVYVVDQPGTLHGNGAIIPIDTVTSTAGPPITVKGWPSILVIAPPSSGTHTSGHRP